MPEKRKAEKLPSERGRIIHHLGKWCIAPCRGRSPLPLRSAQSQRPLLVGSAPCGQRMISVDFQSASIITGEKVSFAALHPSSALAPPATPLLTC